MKANGQAVNRLFEIEPEEVSLVDRAANQRRFLVVKRSNTMKKRDKTKTAKQHEEVQDLAAEVEAEEAAAAEAAKSTASSEGEEAGSEAQPAADGGAEGGAISLAVEALEKLTEAVESLGSVDDSEETRGRVAELASELATVADKLAGLAGVSQSAQDAADDVSTSAPTEVATDTEDSPLAKAVASVRETLASVSALVDQAVAAQQAPPATVASPAPADPAPNADAELSKSVTSLTGMVKEQQQRLTRLEKRFGLPNSIPAEKVTKKDDEEEVGWPLDLNRPCDRSSVDKAVSFHDL